MKNPCNRKVSALQRNAKDCSRSSKVLHLHRSHRNLVVRQASAEFSGMTVLTGIEKCEHFLHLVFGSRFDFDLFVHSARPNERRVEPFAIVGCHDYNVALLAGNPVQRIQQPTERYAAAL